MEVKAAATSPPVSDSAVAIVRPRARAPASADSGEPDTDYLASTARGATTERLMRTISLP